MITSHGRPKGLRYGVAVAGLVLVSAGCRQDMHDQPRYEPLEASDFYGDRRASRAPVEGTIARGYLDAGQWTPAATPEAQPPNPLPLTREVLARGRERFDIYCAPCHDRLGNGDGMIVRRGYRRPPSLHIDRLRQAPDGHFFDVMTRGFGAMPDYAAQIAERDRWAIAAYVRALQLSQHATVEDIPPAERHVLDQSGAPAAPGRQDGPPHD